MLRPMASTSVSALAVFMAGWASPLAAEEPRAHSTTMSDDSADALDARARAGSEAAMSAAAAPSQMTQRAKGAAEAAQSQTLRLLMGDMSQRVFEALGVEDEANIVVETSPPPEGHPAAAMLVFVSSSMPLTTLRRYAAALERTGGAIVLRGGVGGLKTMAPTVDLMMRILKIDPACNGPDCDMREVSILIDPIVFAAAGVVRVPAVAIVDRDPFQSYCERETPAPRSDPWILTYGDASAEGHLEELARRGEPRAAGVLAALRSARAP